MLNKNQIEDGKGLRICIIALYPLCLVTFAAMGLLIFSEQEPSGTFLHRSELFYVRLVWFEILFSIGWFFGLIEPIFGVLKFRQQAGGGYMAISAIVLNACGLSYIILFFSLFFPRSRFFDILPLVLQMGIILFCVLKVIATKGAMILQTDGLDIIPVNIKTPEQLVAMLTICERQPIIEEKYSMAVKRIREKIKYSLPQAGKIATSENYKNLAIEVEAFYDKMMNGKYDEISCSLLRIEKDIIQVIFDCKN